MRSSRRVDLVGVAVGSGVLAATGELARRRVWDIESAIFQRINGLRGDAYRAIWIPMQYGSFGAVPLLAVIALVRRRPRLALAIGTAGTASWLLAKAVKPMVGRPRPNELLAGVHLRGKEEGDLGFPSGHAAVSSALTLALWPHLPARWRPLVATLSALVSFARIHVGAHLPLDVVGGAALGCAIGSTVDLAVSPARAGSARPPAAGAARRRTVRSLPGDSRD